MNKAVMQDEMDDASRPTKLGEAPLPSIAPQDTAISLPAETQDEMKNASVSINTEEVLLYPPTPLDIATALPAAPLAPGHSYKPYTWNWLNHILDFVDVKTGGKAGLVQRVISYLFFGGTAALVNLGIFYIMYHHVLTSLPAGLRNALSYIVAAELSILANFIPNDRFTFSSLPGAKRPWIQRCLRFHLTTIVGSILTFLIEFTLSSLTPIDAVFAEAIATMIVLVYNFTLHHVFTYRHIKEA